MLSKTGGQSNVKVPIKLIVDAEIEDYDNFVKQIKERGGDL